MRWPAGLSGCAVMGHETQVADDSASRDRSHPQCSLYCGGLDVKPRRDAQATRGTGTKKPKRAFRWRCKRRALALWTTQHFEYRTQAHY